MKIAIHHTLGTFSDRWVEYCKEKDIDYKIVDAYSSDIIHQISDCNAFMWHHHHGNYRDVLFAKQLLYSLEERGVRVFPNWRTCWHFDDKVGQKYLLEALGIPTVPSYVFYTKVEALKWAEKTDFPKVFKLRGGAGSSNVRLAHNIKEARQLIQKAFGNGFPQFDSWAYFKDRLNKWRNGRTTLTTVCKAWGRIFMPTEFAKMHGPEKGYVYFQDFIPNNKYDIRVIVIGDKAFAIKRVVRDNDFRASGSGCLLYDKREINEECVEIAFKANRLLQTQCVAYDFVFKDNTTPLVVEISYGFSMHGYDKCTGFWTEDMQWHEGTFNPQAWMVENLISE